MHLLRVERRSLDETANAVDLDHSPADICFLSFSDSDLAALAAAHDPARHPTLRLASLGALKHPYSIDLYIEKTCARARFVLVRLLGGLDYWRYGVEELAAVARRGGAQLAIVPGDGMEDPRLDAASTPPHDDLRRLWGYFQHGGPENLGACLDAIGWRIGRGALPDPPAPPVAVESFGLDRAACRMQGGGRPTALVLFYRSVYLAADTAPILGLSRALADRGFDVVAAYLTSLKDPRATHPLARLVDDAKPDVILSAMGFSARLGDAPSVLDGADAPVLQVALAGSSEAQWRASSRGLRAADLAMNVVLPEVDGRIMTRAISFKAEAERTDALEFTRVIHQPNESRLSYVASLAAAWARLRRLPAAEKKIALVLSDYPLKGGRVGYAVGLDTYESAVEIARRMAAEGYDVDEPPTSADLANLLTARPAPETLTLAAYADILRRMPPAFVDSVRAAWGEPYDDPAIENGCFCFRVVRLGRLLVAAQPDRGRPNQRKSEYHDGALPPRHAYVAFYAWLREQERIDALIHCGAHGTLEWLPGKAVALAEDCAPEAVLGPVPLVYPFIVNNPGEALQAKRRTAAVVVSHLTPALVAAGAHGATAEIEALFDEYAEAQTLDPKRADVLAEHILARAEDTGLARECGLREDDDALVRLDAWLCDLKEMRIADGLHVFGRSPQGALRDAAIANVGETTARAAIADKIDRCGAAELDSLSKALAGRFVEPGPAGAPARGRSDVLPTGRNIFGTDPRAVPTRTAWELGQRTAAAVLTRYAQDHGDWPRRLVLDLWGSATMRTGGEDLAQALALLGVRPVWDAASTRVSGFEILPLASLGRPRVDVTLRISGLFRDMYPTQIALFDAAVRDVARSDESADDNPLVEAVDAPRIFGAPPGAYGAGLAHALASGEWRGRDELGDAYLAASSFAYRSDEGGEAASDRFADHIAKADAFVHVQDMPGQDILNSDAFSQHEGGFAAAAAKLGAEPALYHVDATAPDKTLVRTVKEEIARVLRARAANPRWIEGMMRHGWRGAAEIAETVDNLHAWAALTDAVDSRQFDLLFDAICGDDRVRDFLESANPPAAIAIAEKFEDAAQRGFWASRRNSSISILAAMRSKHD